MGAPSGLRMIHTQKKKKRRKVKSVVGGPKLELVRDIMHVLVTYFKMDLTNSNREKVATTIFRCSMSAKSVVSGGSLAEIRCSRSANSVVSGGSLAEIRAHSSFYACPYCLQVSNVSRDKQPRIPSLPL